MNDAIVNKWLYSSESECLDFKQCQYDFTSDSERGWSEFLKDVMSMANSWREGDAYIVIGIEDRRDKPNNLIGIDTHIDDASLQQFVNSKVKTPCKFEYLTYTYDQKTIGIVRIPQQKRPVYLDRKFGNLNQGVVYVRRGSSTAVAAPDEVAEMGRYDAGLVVKPDLKLGLYDSKSGLLVSDSSIDVKRRYILINDEVPDYAVNNGFVSLRIGNKNYYRDMVKYLNFCYSYATIQLGIYNGGDVEACNLCFEIEVSDLDSDIQLDCRKVSRPSKDPLCLDFVSMTPGVYIINKLQDRWSVSASVPCVHAKKTVQLDGLIYIQKINGGVVNIATKVYCNGLVSPVNQEFIVNVNSETIEMSWGQFYKLHANLL